LIAVQNVTETIQVSRGANIDNVDFYLVDLRGTKFDARQKAQLVATGAILDEDSQ
jgi:uncharacterized protein YjbI with pentapeptide repeats